MDDEDNDYELERQKTIAENKALLTNLGLDPTKGSAIPRAKSELKTPRSSTSLKRKATATVRHKDDTGPRRRSGRIAGLEAEGETLTKRIEEEEKEREVLRVVNRRVREKVMGIGEMVEESSPSEGGLLEGYLTQIASLKNPRRFPESSGSSKEAYAEKDTLPTEVARLKSAFSNMTLKANAKVTTERVFSMVIHPERTKTLVFVGDKQGVLGIWDALGPADEKVKDEDDTTNGNRTGNGADEVDEEGRIWRVQAHARSSITCMKVDPISGSGLFSTSYDCSLRHLDFATFKSTELFSLPDENMLVTHFDLHPNGQEAWMADKDGGISHCDFRERKTRGERRRWEVQDQGRAAKLGGISVNHLMPHLLVTAGNDQQLRIWDTRHLTSLSPKSVEVSPKASHREPKIKSEDPTIGQSDTAAHLDTHPTSTVSYDRISTLMSSAKGKGLLRSSFQHEKSCSAAYWDPWGRRILTTSYDDRLRVWSMNPQWLEVDEPLSPTHFQPTLKLPHNCQTGRWLTILRAQWSLNMDYMPHFTVGNMKRSLDVITASGDKIVSLWTDDVTAVPAVTTSHPSRVDCVLGGNTSGRIQLWGAS